MEMKEDAWEAELEQIVTQYTDMLFRISYSMCGIAADAEDILQNVFLKLCAKRPHFRDDAHCRAWLIRVTINETKNALRFRAVRREEDIAPLEEILPDREQQEVFRDILLLPARYKIVLQLYYVEGYKTAEIAEILKISPAAVRKRLEKGRKQIPQPFTLYASASDVTGEVDLAANGVLEWGEGTLFLHFGRSGGDIDRVDLYNEAGRLTCYFDVENAESGAAWTRATLSVPYDDYAAYVQDAENPTHEELAALLQAEYEKSDPLDGVTDEMERFAQQYGAAEIDFAPLITGFDIFTKGDSGSAAVYLENPDAAVLEPVHDAQSLSVVGGEGVEWYLDPAQAGEGFTDAIEVDVCFENGRTLSGRIKIEWADGSFRAHFETDG